LGSLFGVRKGRKAKDRGREYGVLGSANTHPEARGKVARLTVEVGGKSQGRGKGSAPNGWICPKKIIEPNHPYINKGTDPPDSVIYPQNRVTRVTQCTVGPLL
jgi:hypothetical protein